MLLQRVSIISICSLYVRQSASPKKKDFKILNKIINNYALNLIAFAYFFNFFFKSMQTHLSKITIGFVSKK